MRDASGRTIDYVRISVTDRCNLRCLYCMPEDGVEMMAHDLLLTYEEIERVVRVFSGLGIKYIRITGGEPMARRGCLDLIEKLGAVPGIEEIAMTTNALLLEGEVERAKAAGLKALNISLDTLDAAMYRRMTRYGDLDKVLRVIDDALRCGMRVKINAVPIKGYNEEALVDLALLARDRKIDVRFIELMPIGCGAGMERLTSQEVLTQLQAALGEMTPDKTKRGFGPAVYVRPEGFAGCVGVISPMSHEFCGDCNRVRLTADGQLKLCLNHKQGLDVRALLRGGISDEALAAALTEAILNKPKNHGFEAQIDDREGRRMNEIGG